MEGNITQLLQNTLTAGGVHDARVQLEKFATERFAEYLYELVKVISNEGADPSVRIVAAVQVKVALSGETAQTVAAKLELWTTRLTPDQRNSIKRALLQTLTVAPSQVSRSIASAINAIAELEMPNNYWPELATHLVEAYKSAADKIGPLQSLGYFAKTAAEQDYQVTPDEVNNILTIIIQGLTLDAPSEMQDAAVSAMENTLDFARHNMENENERNMIMKSILTITESPHQIPRQKAFQCLGTVSSLYYSKLTPYMDAIWNQTMSAIKNSANDEDTAKRALYFWDELAYEEASRKAEQQEYGNNVALEDRDLGFVGKVQEPLTKLVLEYCLLQQDPDAAMAAEEDSTESMFDAAEHCFVSLCDYIGPPIIQYAFNFCNANVGHPDWRHRQAALFAFGAVIRENTTQNIQVGGFLELLQKVLKRAIVDRDGSGRQQAEQAGNFTDAPEFAPTVRETAFWAIGGVCSGHPQVLAQEAIAMGIFQLVGAGLSDVPRVATMAAAALHAYISSLEVHFSMKFDPHFENLVSVLWQTATRPDSDKYQLMENAYETLIKLIEFSADSRSAFVGNLILNQTLMRIEEINQGKVQDMTGFEEVELVDVVHACLLRLQDDVFKYSATMNQPQKQDDFELISKIMLTMVHVLMRQSSNAHADAFQVIGELIRLLEDKYARYHKDLVEFVLKGMAERGSASVCIAATRCCSDMVNALSRNIAPELMHKIMELAINNLKSAEAQKEVKPPNLTLLGDVCFSGGFDKFRRYFPESITFALKAADHPIRITDEDFVVYLNNLREAAIEAIELMILDASMQELQPFLEPLFQLCRQIGAETIDPKNYYTNKPPDFAPQNLGEIRLSYHVDDKVLKPLLGVVYEMATKYSDFINAVQQPANQQQFSALVARGRQSQSKVLSELANDAGTKLRL